MSMPYNAYEIEQARHQRKMEGVKREHLAAIAKQGCPQPNGILSFLNTIRGGLNRDVASQQKAPSITEAVQMSTNG